ncbi:hypothetical protein [Streptomyces gibsoniae]|uniref:Lipoprotein n=1 Tax=Streptomyces gibsoniae TaxID=3075529 RepID=A0ABU2U217_9ACTN|nr:hypothetical protein [Streptomyces sp. DSM 41699]MDT0467267.1 hypothetical protein [Streptomyces sp. DSM 41699]
MAAAPVLGLSIAGCQASASPSSQSQGNEGGGSYEVIHLHGETTQSKRIENGDHATGVGNQVLITEKLVRDGNKDGFSATRCTQVGGSLNPTPEKPNTQLCSGVYSLGNGQITWQNTLAVTSQGIPAPWKTAITGGTGTYANARGYVLVNGAARDYTVYLVRTSS